MNDYILCTTKQIFLRKVKKIKTIVMLLAVPLWIIQSILNIPFIFTEFYWKEISQYKSRLKKLLTIKIWNDYKGLYNGLTNNILLNLENFEGNENKIIKEIIFTITHEDLHKAVDFKYDNQEFILGKIGY